ncbi:hypothetical protein GOP47_0022044 [Adiantum capillus-veneris]|uniref:TLDc domain-containing protein n=1 Tax=Adiantum capillus-veneris TaxID=13818 RepID=A0A9D4U8Z9_ADICA|nr:hypothetical protein GOP47_0022044 [Adiantum capillus-veneris]
MGTSSSRQADAEAAEIKSLESRLSSLGDLHALHAIFSHLSPSSAPIAPDILKKHFELKMEGISCPPSSQLGTLSQSVASTIIDVIFKPDEKGISWKALLEGVEKCHQPSVSVKLNLLLYFFYNLKKKGKLPLLFSFEDEDSSHLPQAGLTGHLTLSELQDFFWLCWLLAYSAFSHAKCSHLPNVEPLMKSAQAACSDGNVEKETLSMEKLHKWMLLTIPRLPFSLFDFIRACVHQTAMIFQEENAMPCNSEEQHDSKLLGSESYFARQLFDSNVAWAIGLSLSDILGTKILSCCFSQPPDTASLLYRSSIHGKGMNRFWVHMEGYQGTVLMLIQGVTLHNMEDSLPDNLGEDQWLLGALVSEGFVNNSCFYGSRGCCIFALDPVMKPFRPTGIGSNFVYSHSHAATSTSYLEQQRGPEGIAFGGDIGKERLLLNDDFMHVIIHHHSLDKTYEAGPLLPNQGYHTIRGKVIDVEVWGFGGAATMEKQAQFQGRKNLFVEQRRKVDLQSFGNWSDSPEKMMMDMVSDPNRGQRQDR